MPRLALGDYVVVTGTWALYSPHDEHNIAGLLVYKALEHVAPPAAPPATSPVSPAAEPEVEPLASQMLSQMGKKH